MPYQLSPSMLEFNPWLWAACAAVILALCWRDLMAPAVRAVSYLRRVCAGLLVLGIACSAVVYARTASEVRVPTRPTPRIFVPNLLPTEDAMSVIPIQFRPQRKPLEPTQRVIVRDPCSEEYLRGWCGDQWEWCYYLTGCGLIP